MRAPLVPTPATPEARAAAVRRRAVLAPRGLLAALLVLTMLDRSGHARAETNDHLVLLLRPLPASSLSDEIVLRMKSELAAGGFQVMVVDTRAADATPARLIAQAEAAYVRSAIGFAGPLEEGRAELWLVDRGADKPLFRSVPVVASNRRVSEVLAIRAQEMLRASLLAIAPAEAPNEPPAEASVAEEAVQVQARRALAVEVGGAWLTAWQGGGAILAPTARARAAIARWWDVRLTLAGLGSTTTVRSHVGSATIAHAIGLAEVVAWLRADGLLRPVLTVGLGTERIALRGSAVAPYQDAHDARWFAVGDLGAGVAASMAPPWNSQARWQAQLELHALFTLPRPRIRFLDIDGPRARQPGLMATLTLAAGL